MNKKEYSLDVIPQKQKGQMTYPPSKQFVKATHIESGISCTGFGDNQLKARDMALFKLESHVNMWENA
jgi:hypothetical protein